MKRMSLTSRVMTGIASLALIATFFLPVWFIYLTAPQYPEGLTMNIWLTKITGQVDIINGLNHYIGMKHINADMFPEFNYLIYILGFFIAFGLLVAITGNRKLLLSYLILTIVGSITALYDFYSWGYKYGHNLDPNAPIQVPGLYYQPPVIGHKTLLNFDAYSYPSAGGWIIVLVSAIFFLVYFLELHRYRKSKMNVALLSKNTIRVAAAFLILFFSSCNLKPEPFIYGKDVCSDCRMTIMDPKFGAELITKKGKLYKFDDAHCIAHFIKSGAIKSTDIAQIVFINYENDKIFLKSSSLFFAVSPELKSPMNSNAVAFSSWDKANKKANETNGEVQTWDQIFNNSK